MEKQGLQEKTIKSLIYSFSGFFAKTGIAFVFGVMLARLLLPKDYGIIGMIAIFMAISQIFIDGGMSSALIREKTSSQEDYSTVFYYNIIISLFAYVLLFLSARTISSFFREPLLVPIVRIIGLNLIIGSLGLVQRTLLVKNLNFKTEAKIEIMSSILSGLIAIFLAYSGYGVWSLVFSALSRQLFALVLLITHNRWIPSFLFSKDSFQRLFGFGWKMLLTGFLATIYNNLYNILIGRIFSANVLGYYTKSLQLQKLAAESITVSVSKVSYPILSQLQDDPFRFKAGFKKIIRHSSFLTFPLMIGLAAAARPLIHILFGDNWIAMTPYFQILCLSGMTLPHRSINLNILQVTGRSDLFLKLDVLSIAIGLSFIGAIVFLNLSIYVLLWTTFLMAQITLVVYSFFSKHFIDYSTKEQVRDMLPSLCASLLMGGIVYSIDIFSPFHSFIKIFLQVNVGIAIYIVLCKAMNIKELESTYDIIAYIARTALRRLSFRKKKYL